MKTNLQNQFPANRSVKQRGVSPWSNNSRGPYLRKSGSQLSLGNGNAAGVVIASGQKFGRTGNCIKSGQTISGQPEGKAAGSLGPGQSKSPGSYLRKSGSFICTVDPKFKEFENDGRNKVDHHGFGEVLWVHVGKPLVVSNAGGAS